MKNLLPQVFPRDLLSVAVIAAGFVLVSCPATAQDSTQYDHRKRLGSHADAALSIEVQVVTYSMTPPKHHHGDNDDAAAVYNIPSREPAMSVIEEERPIAGRVAFGPTVIDAGRGALLKTTTVVPE